jgi:phosphoserine aminotransferase
MAVYLTPGPSQPYPGLRGFIEDAWTEDVMAISHRGSTFQSIYQRTDAALREIMDVPTNYSVLFVGSATEAMDRTIQGTVRRRSHHFVNGAFAEKWFEIAKALGKQPSVCRATAGHEFKTKDLMIPKDAELICLTQNETSTGSMFPVSLHKKSCRHKAGQATHRARCCILGASDCPTLGGT